MTEQEKLEKTIDVATKNEIDPEGWKITLLASIASSLAVIADKMTKKDIK